MGDTPSTTNLRLDAAKEFAQTMILIDDEASQVPQREQAPPVGGLRRPDRKTRAHIEDPPARPQAQPESKHALDAKALIDEAMNLGLICSVLRPKEGENFRRRVVKAAQSADIVCLDWEIYGDSGDAATKIICDIIKNDERQNGRLRLIAIYTGDKTNNLILQKIFDAIPQKHRSNHELKRERLELVSKSGLKIVCLFKTHGIQLPQASQDHQVSEKELPGRLQTEFATLSEGALSNLALATIGAIRGSTHHILSKFSGDMDGPYFHHRATIKSPEDAQEYGVDIILSELQGAVHKNGVADKYIGAQAIRARIKEIAGDADKLVLNFEKNGELKTFDLPLEAALKIVTSGLRSVPHEDRGRDAPSNKLFEKNLASLFTDGLSSAKAHMRRFAALTGTRAHPGSYLYRTEGELPQLGLGSVIQATDKSYLLCLQASCDSVRIEGKKAFLFVPLEVDNSLPEHVVPVPLSTGGAGFVGLSTSTESYRVVRSIEFAGSTNTKTVVAKKLYRRSGFHFEDTSGKHYRWIADLKRRRALRTAQKLGQDMGRLGFDEFEPFRQRSHEQ